MILAPRTNQDVAESARLLNRADTYLYQAKALGRNQIAMQNNA